MDLPAEGDTLLVGEGDFSFCVAMVNKLPPDKHSTITATSLETDESIHKHQDALENIQIITAKGVQVKLDTDATKLHEDPYFRGRSYARIIFNFPHAGGKSNHKKNRKLLKEFFASATTVLGVQGQVFVTLAKGQGGTPADKPRRAWPDSWQVVAMAADADLILVQVLPFYSEDYRTYSSTGFRSQDKGFNTQNAITHIFERAERVEIPQHITIPVCINGSVYNCPRYILDRLKTIRSIRQNIHHPLNTLYSSMARYLSTKSNTSNLGMLESVRCWKHDISSHEPNLYPSRCTFLQSETLVSEVQDNLDDMVEKFDQLDDPEQQKYRVVCDQEDFAQIAASVVGDGKLDEKCLTVGDGKWDEKCTTVGDRKWDEKCTTVGDRKWNEKCTTVGDGKWDNEKCTTRPSRDQLYISCCPIFKTSQSFSSSPFTYSVAVVRCVTPEELGYTDASHSVEIGEEALRTCIENTAVSVSDFINSVLPDKKVEVSLHDLLKFDNDDKKDSDKCHCVGRICFERNCVVGTESCKDTECCSTVEVGKIFVAGLLKTNLPVYNIIATVDIGELACIMYNITDRRLLWSQDYRVLEVFKSLVKQPRTGTESSEGLVCDNIQSSNVVLKKEHASGTALSERLRRIGNTKLSAGTDECVIKENHVLARNAAVITGPSLYPLTCVHDMSFWENETAVFDEVLYFSVIRDVAVDNVVSVELIDTFVDPTIGRRSRCYRLTFQSADQALPYDTTWKLQSMIRIEVERVMNITLR